MSGAYFQHTCPVTRTSTQRTARWVCKKCGQRALFAGWRFSVVELWCAYQRRTGFVPFGPHRPLADQLLGEIDPGPCPACAGRGAIDPDADDYPLTCQSCDGSGDAPYPPAELARVQARVHAEWPPDRVKAEREKQSARFPPRSSSTAMSATGTGASLHIAVITAILVPLGLGGGVGLLSKGRVIEGLFLLHIGASMAFMALLASGVVTLRLRTARVVVLVLLAVFVLLFLLVVGHGAGNAPG